ncbi:glycosyltransferase [Planktotalea sp.]|uniref:glycosyltransferase n=1 Tax=Planktotalea sp. TaxID=2029877 RepID=UPI003D6B5857
MPRIATQNYPPLRHKSKSPFGRLLVDRGLIRSSDVLAALGRQSASDAHLGQILLARNLITETQLYQTLALQYGATYLDAEAVPADPKLVQQLEPQEALRLQAVPWARNGPETLIATSLPAEFENTCAALPPHLLPATMVVVNKSTIEAVVCASGSDVLAQRAEVSVPEDLSCRNLPNQIKTLLAAVIPLALIALALNWFALSDLYRALFFFAVSMVCVGIVIKTTAAFLQLASKTPLFARAKSPPNKLPNVSLLIPLHDESDILDALLHRIGRLTYPKALLDVLVIVEQNDTRTRAHLETKELPSWMRVLVVPPGRITTKPRALNYALPFCRGDIIGIYDAEDAPHPDQISDVVSAFHALPHSTACIQAILDFYNARANALSRFFAIEYATWFRLVLPGVARMGFAIPLGGTSVFFRTKILKELHGWDAHNVTEDADLGIRLARAGYRTALIDSVTMEEANNAPWPWIKQRSRWLKGYLITYFTHMRRPVRLLFELGMWKFLGFQAFFLSSISQYLLAPLIWSCMLLYLGAPHWMASALPVSLLATLMVGFIAMWCASTIVYIIAVSGKTHRHLIPWSICMSVYMSLGTLAIYKGAWELLTRPFYWEKTSHGHSSKNSNQKDVHAPPESSLSRVTKATEI